MPWPDDPMNLRNPICEEDRRRRAAAPASRDIEIGPAGRQSGGRFEVAIPSIRPLCSTCHVKDLCLARDLGGSDLRRLEGIISSRRRVKEGQPLYLEGDRFLFIYAVRSGTFKSELTAADGREQVTGFQMAGELLGLDGLASGQHASSATALEDAEVCGISYQNLSALDSGSMDLHHGTARLMSRQIVRDQGLMLMLGSMNAEERLAAFLLNLSRRSKIRGYSPDEFHLRMSRADIGSYLGMKLETVSRAFSSFQQRRLLEVDRRHVKITDLARLMQEFDLHAR